MRSNSLNKVTVVLLLSFIFGTFLVLTLVRESEKPRNPRETVEFFGKLLEKGEKKRIEDYVTTVPLLYKKQVQERIDKNLAAQFNPTEIKLDDPNFQREAPYPEPVDVSRNTVNLTKLVEKVLPDDIVPGEVRLGQIAEVTESDGQALVEVLYGKKSDKNPPAIRTKFWLNKDRDGQWRVFQVTNFEFNPQWAHKP